MKQNRKFIIGVAFTLIGFLIFLCKSFLMIFGFLFSAIGIIFILISKKIWLQKLIWTTVIIIMTYCFYMFGVYRLGAKALEEIYFSSNFKGKVRILYAKDCGITPEKRGDWSIINVDTNHVLVIKRENRRVFTKKKYFIVDENGNKTSLQSISDPADFKSEITILNNYTGHYKDRDINIQEYILMHDANDLPSVAENKRIELLALEKLRELNCK